jgi:hypothetical protein
MALPEPLKRPADAAVHGLIQQQAEGQGAALTGADLVHLIEQCVQVIQNGGQVAIQMLTGGGQLNCVVRAIKQLGAQFILQCRHLSADGGLRNILLLGCNGKAVAFGNNHKRFQLGDRHGKSRPLRSRCGSLF